MDADGTLDMVFSACPSARDCSLHIVYNQQMPICREGSALPCRDPHNLCVADPAFQFDVKSLGLHHSVFKIDSWLPGQTIVKDDASFRGVLPVPCRIGDYNNDGYPDILLLASSIVDPSATFVVVLESVPVNGAKRSFIPLQRGMEGVQRYHSPVGATFIDFNNDGALDIMIFYQERSTLKIYTTLFSNAFFFDAFFFRPTTLSSLCLGSCPYNPNVSQVGWRC
ncbi:hypothetical protein HDU91_004354 [Kappamyces sp. JEL0680]|nr:hypothetical protein HDU91_004354 [Kappamyces sp. JEL0680]